MKRITTDALILEVLLGHDLSRAKSTDARQSLSTRFGLPADASRLHRDFWLRKFDSRASTTWQRAANLRDALAAFALTHGDAWRRHLASHSRSAGPRPPPFPMERATWAWRATNSYLAETPYADNEYRLRLEARLAAASVAWAKGGGFTPDDEGLYQTIEICMAHAQGLPIPTTQRHLFEVLQQGDQSRRSQMLCKIDEALQRAADQAALNDPIGVPLYKPL